MNSLIAVMDKINDEIAMSDQCLLNILARLDEDVVRINERKQQITEEFAARRRALQSLLGVPVEPEGPANG